MAKEQLAVIEMVTNMILGKTEGISKVDFVPHFHHVFLLLFLYTIRNSTLSAVLYMM